MLRERPDRKESRSCSSVSSSAAAGASVSSSVAPPASAAMVEPLGLMRIKGYVGKLPTPRTLAEGADILRQLGAAQFPKLDADGWLRQARLTWNKHGNRYLLAYDPQLARALD